VTNHPADDIYPGWSHDGGWIYFASNRTGRWEVWKMPTEGGEPVQVTHSGGYVALESPDGKYLYYSKSVQSGLFRMPVGSGAEEQVLPKISGGSSFGVTAKGVYFQPDPSKIQFLGPASGQVSTLATLDQEGYGLTVSPDDAHVVWLYFDPAICDLMLVEGFR
jgi:hypothetical protein